MIHMFVTFVLFFYHLNFVVYFSLWVNIRFLAAFKWPTWQMQYVCSMYTSLLCLVDAKHKFILQWGGRYKMTRRTNVSITSAKLQHSGMVVIRCFAFFSALTCIHEAITSGKNPRGKRIIPNSDSATNALEAVRLWPVRTYTANVVTATWKWNNKEWIWTELKIQITLTTLVIVRTSS